MAAALRTDVTGDPSEGDIITLMTTDELVKQSFPCLSVGALESAGNESRRSTRARELGLLGLADYVKAGKEVLK
jgi:hypothetical protein